MNIIKLFRYYNHWPNINIYRMITMPRNKFDLHLNKDVQKALEDGLRWRSHPGIRHNPSVEVPWQLNSAVQSIINKYKGKRFRRDVEDIHREFLDVIVQSANPDDEGIIVPRATYQSERTKMELNEEYVPSKRKLPVDFDDLRRKFFMRAPYSAYECATHMTARMAANYAALSYIFHEIQYEEPEFMPSTLFDFGSGIGTTVWVADHYWKDKINEIFCVDLNENMNELSRELLKKGTPNNEKILDNVFYRQFLPAKHIPSYDLVVSAFSLLEFPDTNSRINVIENLWKKTSGALVLVEHGSKAGFTAIMEARNFVLQVGNKQLDPLAATDNQTTHVSQNLVNAEGSVMAPCPHDLTCPRQKVATGKAFCNFAVKYKTFDYGQPNPGVKLEKFAYVVLKKNNLPIWKEEQKHWPRIVQPVVNKHKHSYCRLCTNKGELHEVVLTKKNNTTELYRSARVSDWGDKLPIDIEPQKENVYIEKEGEEEEKHNDNK